LPDKAEDIPLKDLSSSVQNSFGGKLGKKSMSLIDRMISSKMPGSFKIGAVRTYLKGKYGFANGHQDGILISAVAAQPDAGLKDDGAAKTFWDGIVQSYLQANGITLQQGSSSGGTGAQQGTMIDPETLKMLQKGPTEHYQLQLQLYAKQLGVDLDASNKVEGALKDAINILQKDLNLWNEEHGHAYAQGIKPFFDPLKHRRYDSYWNWVLQDLYILFYGILNGSVKLTDTETIDRRARLINRSTPRLVKTMSFLRSSLPSRQGKNVAAARVLLAQLIADCQKSLDQAPLAIMAQNLTGPRTVIDREGNIKYEEVLRPLVYKSKKEKRRHEHIVTIQEYDSGVGSASSDNDDFSDSDFNTPIEASPRLGYDGLSRRTGNRSWQVAVKTATLSGVSFHKKNVLLTGAGKGSIGAEILKGLLAGGANVLVTTNSYSPEVTRRFQDLYAKYGARGSQLVVVPFNQGSQQDVEALISWIYDKNGLGWDLDHVIPFAAISENGRQIDRIDSRSELAHRLMLTNTVRLLGAIKRQKAEANIITRPAHVLLPMSPNHGIFGNDGLYAESKLGLHSLLNKWHSENWQDYLLICGVTIGWTRGTALMNDNDIVAEGIEKLGIKTYSQEEMAFNILGLMSPAAVAITQTEPLLADLSGGMDQIADLKAETDRIRQQIYSTSEVRRALAQEMSETRNAHQKHITAPVLEQRANIQLDFPRLPDYQTEIEAIRSRGKPLVDLDSVVVIAGFAELGPYGNARTRWQMEAYGKFSLEGCVELAWMMGLIKPNRDGKVKEDGSYAGWIDAKTGIPVSDMEVKQKYEPYILEHTGLRFIEPRSHEEPDIASRRVLHEVEIQDDMPPFEASKETAEELKREHKENVEISAIADSEDRVQVILKKGARLHIPKALDFNRFVAGQIPTGWDPRAYGIPDDIINQVDPATLYPLVCTIEAFISAGITDPYELYKYIHVTEVGNCLGSGMGGATSLQRIFKERLLDKPVANDILAESFINSAAAWVNMLLLSAAGPIHTPVGACATAVESLTLGHELITSGKAKAVLVGGYDDLIRDMAYEFAQMKATNNVVDDLAHGRSPKEMSRPATSTRAGFVESEGCGIQIITSARLALDMGLPIHGIVALAQTNSDRTGRSLPAPGKGVLTNAAQLNSKIMSPLMNRDYRQRNVELRLRQISEVEAREMQILEEEITMLKSGGEAIEDEHVRQRRADITAEAHRQKRHALYHYGNGFWKQDTRISPISGSLAVWGLTIDDLDVASFHGTSTKLNEKNECSVVQKQLSHLGRTQGNEIFGVFQKHLTGHPKGAAGAWMLNGCLQIMNTGLIPGNRNADNIDQVLEPFDYICFPNQTIQKTDEAGGVKAFSVTSFGFGQKGSQVIGVHPKYLYAALEEQEYAAYSRKLEQRQQAAYRYFHQAISGGKMFVPKDKAPFADEREVEFFLNPELRVG
jgi:fatty acid synthase subunit alpha